MKKALCILICVLIGTAALSALIATGCSPPPSDPINPLVLASVGTKGHFRVELVNGYPNNNYTNNTQAWCYNVTVLSEKGDLSHWCLNLCDEPKHEVLNWTGPAEKVEHTDPTWDDGTHGHVIKWDGTTLKPEENAIFCFTLEGIWEESTGVAWFAKNGIHWDDTGTITGPSCTPLYTPPIQYNLTISSTIGGSVIDPGEGTFTYNEGTVAGLVAETEEGYRFVNWIGDVGTIADDEDISTTITMDNDYSITANFEAIPPVNYNLTISSTTGGSATATINPTTVIGPGEIKTISDIPAGTGVDLVASPDTGYEFLKWTGEPIDGVIDAVTAITMQNNYVITANFKAVPVIPPPPVTVGWETRPINKLAILTPWIILFTVIMAGAILLALKCRRT